MRFIDRLTRFDQHMNGSVNRWTLLCVVIGLMVVIFSRCSDRAPRQVQAQAPERISIEGFSVQRVDIAGSCFVYKVVVDGHAGAFASCSGNGVPIYLLQ